MGNVHVSINALLLLKSFALLSVLSCPEDLLTKSVLVVLRAFQMLPEEAAAPGESQSPGKESQVASGKGKGAIKLGTTWSTQKDLSGHRPNS